MIPADLDIYCAPEICENVPGIGLHLRLNVTIRCTEWGVPRTLVIESTRRGWVAEWGPEWPTDCDESDLDALAEEIIGESIQHFSQPERDRFLQ